MQNSVRQAHMPTSAATEEGGEEGRKKSRGWKTERGEIIRAERKKKKVRQRQISTKTQEKN